MTNHHPLNDFPYRIFPDAEAFGHSPGRLFEHLTDFYTFGPYCLIFTIKSDLVEVELDTLAISSQQGEYNKVLKMCEAGSKS